MLSTIGLILLVAILFSLSVWLIIRFTPRNEGSQQDIQNSLNNALSDLRVATDRLQNVTSENERLQSEMAKLIGLKEEALTLLSAERTRVEEQAKREQDLRIQLDSKAKELERIVSDLYAQREKTIEFEKENIYLKEQLQKQREELDEIGKKFTNEFKLLADQVLEDKSKRFTELNQTNMERLLKPLGENLTQFQRKVEEVYDKESKERFSLGKEVEKLVGLNQRISEEAQNLTNALKGQVKQQGNWGEMILESILEKSGLVKGREYFVQESIKNEEGKRFQPDVIIEYPDKRRVVIDSKVSLVAYERYSTSNNPAEQEKALAEHLRSIRAHIEILSSKRYQELVRSLDFVSMFLPIEPAYMLAMQADPEIWNYAYSKGVLLLSPTNLIAALRLIHNLWQREYQNRHAMEIAERGGQLFDKFVNFTENMLAIGDNISKTHKAYESAMGQLTEGKGNLVAQAQKLKDLGAKAKKSLPESLMDGTNDSENQPLTN